MNGIKGSDANVICDSLILLLTKKGRIDPNSWMLVMVMLFLLASSLLFQSIYGFDEDFVVTFSPLKIVCCGPGSFQSQYCNQSREFDMRFTLIKCHFLFDLAIKQPHLQWLFATRKSWQLTSILVLQLERHMLYLQVTLQSVFIIRYLGA